VRGGSFSSWRERVRRGVSSVICRCFIVGGEGDKGGARWIVTGKRGTKGGREKWGKKGKKMRAKILIRLESRIRLATRVL